MQKLLKAGVVAVLLTLFGGANVYAADKGPTVSDAHELLGDLANKGLLYASGFKNDPIDSYQGSGCTSTAHANIDGDWTMLIDWSAVTSAGRDTKVGDELNVKFYGVVSYKTTRGPSKHDWGQFLTIDEVSRNRVEKAVNLLIKSCNKFSKFD